MEQKPIIGISSFAGSDTTAILAEVQELISRRSDKTLRTYSLKEYSSRDLIDIVTAVRTENNIIRVIKHIRELEVLRFLKKELKEREEDFRPIGIEIPWEDCFANFQRKGLIAPDANRDEWRKDDELSLFRLRIKECYDKEIGSRNDNIYLIEDGNWHEQIGKLADMFRLL